MGPFPFPGMRPPLRIHSFLSQGGHTGLGEKGRGPAEPPWSVLCRLCLVGAREPPLEVGTWEVVGEPLGDIPQGVPEPVTQQEIRLPGAGNASPSLLMADGWQAAG